MILRSGSNVIFLLYLPKITGLYDGIFAHFYPFVLLAVQNNTDNDYKNRGYF